MNFRYLVIRHLYFLSFSIVTELPIEVAAREDIFFFPWKRLHCPYDEERVGVEVSEPYHIEYVEYDELVLIPCCLKYNTTVYFEKYWFKTNRFFTNEAKRVKEEIPSYEREHGIIGMREKDVGVYYCQEDSTIMNVNSFFYILDLEYPGAPVVRGDINVYHNYTKNYLNKIQSYLSDPSKNDDESVRKLYDITGLGLRATIRWDPWTECDYCLGEKVRKGRCHLEPYVINAKLCVANCIMYKYTLHMDCRAYWTVVKILPRLAELIKDVPNVEAVVKCIGQCSNSDIKPGFSYQHKLRTRILTVGVSSVFACPGFTSKKLCYWRYNGIKIWPGKYDSDANVNVNEFCQLYIQDVTIEQAGNYTCYLDDKLVQENKLVVEEFKQELIKEQWWRHVKYLLYVALLCFIILIGGIAVAYIQRENFTHLDHDTLVKNFQMGKFDFEKM